MPRPQVGGSSTEMAENAPAAGPGQTSPRSIEAGGKFASQVCGTLELWRRILVLLDKKTLAVVLRVEKAVTTSVAEVLYREVHFNMTIKMSRANPRRKAYCDAVRIMDRSPLPTLTPAHPRQKTIPLPNRFDPPKFLEQLAVWRKKYPNLQRIDYLYPANDADDAYVVHLSEDRVMVELESHVQLELHHGPFVAPAFPPVPSYPGLEFRHTIAVQLVCPADYSLEDRPALLAHSQEWTKFLYRNEALDRRITSVQDLVLQYGIELPFGEALACYRKRQANGCEPIAKFFSRSGATADFDITELCEALGPALRVMQCLALSTRDLSELQRAVTVLDKAHAGLHQLRVGFCNSESRASPPDSWTRLTGLRHLRKLIIEDDSRMELPFARCLRGLGGAGCIVQNIRLRTVRQMAEFQALIRGDEW